MPGNRSGRQGKKTYRGSLRCDFDTLYERSMSRRMLSPEHRSHFLILWPVSGGPAALDQTSSGQQRALLTHPSALFTFHFVNSQLTLSQTTPLSFEFLVMMAPNLNPHPGSLFMYSIVVPDVGNDWESVFWEIACSSVMWGAFINDTDHYSFCLLLCRWQEWMLPTNKGKKRQTR